MWNISKRTVLPCCTTRFQQLSLQLHLAEHSKIIAVLFRKFSVSTRNPSSSCRYGMIRSSVSSSWERHEHVLGSHFDPQLQPALNESSTRSTPCCSLYSLINSKFVMRLEHSLLYSKARVTGGPLTAGNLSSKALRKWWREDSSSFLVLSRRFMHFGGSNQERGISPRLTLFAGGYAPLRAWTAYASVG